MNCQASTMPDDFLTTEEGRRVGRKVWEECLEVFERVSPGRIMVLAV